MTFGGRSVTRAQTLQTIQTQSDRLLGTGLMDASKMRPILVALYECGYGRFRRMIKKNTPPRSLRHWFRLARDPETPIPDFTRVYDKKLGLKQNT